MMHSIPLCGCNYSSGSSIGFLISQLDFGLRVFTHTHTHLRSLSTGTQDKLEVCTFVYVVTSCKMEQWVPEGVGICGWLRVRIPSEFCQNAHAARGGPGTGVVLKVCRRRGACVSVGGGDNQRKKGVFEAGAKTQRFWIIYGPRRASVSAFVRGWEKRDLNGLHTPQGPRFDSTGSLPGGQGEGGETGAAG